MRQLGLLQLLSEVLLRITLMMLKELWMMVSML